MRKNFGLTSASSYSCHSLNVLSPKESTSSNIPYGVLDHLVGCSLGWLLNCSLARLLAQLVKYMRNIMFL
jgi:hypothetical protein